MARLRRAGARWRLLVHGPRGISHSVSSASGEDSEHRKHHHLPGTEFDELAVGSWLRIEELEAGLWWMNVGGVTIHVSVNRNGRPSQVTVHGPGDFADYERGVAYYLVWRDAAGRSTGARAALDDTTPETAKPRDDGATPATEEDR